MSGVAFGGVKATESRRGCGSISSRQTSLRFSPSASLLSDCKLVLFSQVDSPAFLHLSSSAAAAAQFTPLCLTVDFVAKRAFFRSFLEASSINSSTNTTTTFCLVAPLLTQKVVFNRLSSNSSPSRTFAAPA